MAEIPSTAQRVCNSPPAPISRAHSSWESTENLSLCATGQAVVTLWVWLGLFLRGRSGEGHACLVCLFLYLFLDNNFKALKITDAAALHVTRFKQTKKETLS